MTTEELAIFRETKMGGFIDAWFDSIKIRSGYEEGVMAYDDEIRDLVEAAVTDMLTAGVSEDLFVTKNLDKRILNALALYVQAYIEQDRSDTNRYQSLYKRTVFKLSLEDGGGWDYVEPNN
jgi:hypothetical protein